MQNIDINIVKTVYFAYTRNPSIMAIASQIGETVQGALKHLICKSFSLEY